MEIVSTTVYEPYRSGYFCTKYRDRSDFQNILHELQLTNVQKEIIKTRYLHILENFQRRTRNYSIIFFFGTNTVWFCSSSGMLHPCGQFLSILQ